MKPIVLTLVFVAGAAGFAFGQGGTLGLFGDPGATSCSIVDESPGLLRIHVVHLFMAGTRGCAFTVAVPECAVGMTWIGDTCDYVPGGLSPTGAAVAYWDCMTSPIHVMTINYWGLGQSGDCCWFTITPDPRQGWGTVIAIDCSYRVVVPAVAPLVLNPGPSCSCASVPMAHTTWGGIKELYSP
jgi:hypothetical protein